MDRPERRRRGPVHRGTAGARAPPPYAGRPAPGAAAPPAIAVRGLDARRAGARRRPSPGCSGRWRCRASANVSSTACGRAARARRSRPTRRGRSCPPRRAPPPRSRRAVPAALTSQRRARVAGGLDEPGEVDDGVRAGEHLVERVRAGCTGRARGQVDGTRQRDARRAGPRSTTGEADHLADRGVGGERLDDPSARCCPSPRSPRPVASHVRHAAGTASVEPRRWTAPPGPARHAPSP